MYKKTENMYLYNCRVFCNYFYLNAWVWVVEVCFMALFKNNILVHA